LQTLSGREDLIALLRRIEDDPTRQALQAERTVVARLEADCHSCLAVHITPFEEGGWQGYAMAGDPAGGKMLRSHTRQAQAQQVADTLYEALADGGAHEWFSPPG
jgi:porphobilinogen deaminase